MTHSLIIYVRCPLHHDIDNLAWDDDDFLWSGTIELKIKCSIYVAKMFKVERKNVQSRTKKCSKSAQR